MVDVGEKEITSREAVAEGRVMMRPETLGRIMEHGIHKGDVFSVACLAGIMGAKETSRLIPLCHNIALASVDVGLTPNVEASTVDIVATVRCTGKTGAEMEALTAVTVAALTVYDMCKAIDRSMEIQYVRLVAKSGGKSGDYRR